jgi:beta-lactamase regulating signal transducer with metallopeptidase domain
MAFLAEGLIQASLTAVVMYIIALVVEKHIYKHFYPTVVGRIWDIIFFRAAFIIPVLTGTVAAAKKAAEESAPHSAGLNNVAVAADTMIIDLHISPFMLSIIVTIWICGAVVFLGIFFYKYFKLVRLLRSRSTPDKDLYYWRQKYSLPVYKSLKRVQVRKSELLSSPILVGCIRKTLYLPEMDLEDTDIQFILEHETTHLKRRDLQTISGEELLGFQKQKRCIYAIFLVS